jgi:hypothetical protein
MPVSLAYRAFMPPPRGTFAQCRSCGGQWNVYRGAAAGEPRPGAVTFVETTRTYEPYVEDEKVFDNRNVSTAATHTFSLRQEWTQDFQIEREEGRANSIGMGIGAPQLGLLEARAEESVRTRYAVGESHQRTFAEELTVPVPANSRCRVVLKYKRLFQDGIARIEMSDGTTRDVPYRIALALSLDWAMYAD